MQRGDGEAVCSVQGTQRIESKREEVKLFLFKTPATIWIVPDLHPLRRRCLSLARLNGSTYRCPYTCPESAISDIYKLTLFHPSILICSKLLQMPCACDLAILSHAPISGAECLPWLEILSFISIIQRILYYIEFEIIW